MDATPQFWGDLLSALWRVAVESPERIGLSKKYLSTYGRGRLSLELHGLPRALVATLSGENQRARIRSLRVIIEDGQVPSLSDFLGLGLPSLQELTVETASDVDEDQDSLAYYEPDTSIKSIFVDPSSIALVPERLPCLRKLSIPCDLFNPSVTLVQLYELKLTEYCKRQTWTTAAAIEQYITIFRNLSFVPAVRRLVLRDALPFTHYDPQSLRDKLGDIPPVELASLTDLTIHDESEDISVFLPYLIYPPTTRHRISYTGSPYGNREIFTALQLLDLSTFPAVAQADTVRILTMSYHLGLGVVLLSGGSPLLSLMLSYLHVIQYMRGWFTARIDELATLLSHGDSRLVTTLEMGLCAEYIWTPDWRRLFRVLPHLTKIRAFCAKRVYDTDSMVQECVRNLLSALGSDSDIGSETESVIRLHSGRRRGARVGEDTNSKLECFSSPIGLIYAERTMYMRQTCVSTQAAGTDNT